MVEAPAIQARPASFQNRASQLFKKVVNIRGKRSAKDAASPPTNPYRHSMGAPGKPFMSHPMLGLEVASPADDGDGSSRSASTSGSQRFSGNSTWSALGNTAHRMAKSSSMPGQTRKIPSVAAAPTQDSLREEVFRPVPEIVVSHPPTPTQPTHPTFRDPTPPHSEALNSKLPAGASSPNPPTSFQRTSPTPPTPPPAPASDTWKPKPHAIPLDTPPLSYPVLKPTALKSAPILTPPTSFALNFPPSPSSPTSASAPSTVRIPAAVPAAFNTQTPKPKPQSHGRPSTAPSTKPERPTTAMRIADMPPSVFRMNENGTAQLSPSILTRRSAAPMLNLPLLPTPVAAAPRYPPRPAANLRSMPALSHQGYNDMHQDADHGNSALEEDDDEEDDEEAHTPPSGGSDEEGEDLARSSMDLPPPAPRRMKLPTIDTGRIDISFSFPGKAKVPAGAAPGSREDATPTATTSFDYFSVVPQPGPSETPRASTSRQAALSPTTPGGRAIPMPSPRPAMYHQVSRSMVNILSPKVEPPLPEPASAIDGKGKAPDRAGPAGPLLSPTPAYAPREPASPVTPLRRQRSMPMFNAASAPPPYPTFAPHPMRSVFLIQPRDDEGMERLPAYSNAIHLLAVMPRKMEFTAPGVQAKDRKWRRALCELQGTAFRVYKCPHGVAGGGVISEWWEKKVGAGDAATAATAVAKPERAGDVLERPAKLTEDSRPLSTAGEAQPEREETHTTIVLPKPKRLNASILHPSSLGAGSRSDSHERAPRSSLNLARSASPLDTGSAGNASSSMSSSATSSNVSTQVPGSRPSFLPKSTGNKRSSVSGVRSSIEQLANPDPADLIRAYSVQNAESGLGNDYVKRKNVIRVRMEGEQFLLQAQDVADVVEWIEGLHAATNIALDLDERVMPKGPMFPRRRRRRRPRDAAATPASS